ncbi:MAG: histidinol-phosphate aminotransferase, partial [Acidimicrobiaceae bacterium]|nr:histidinol-phosphate aminotransferase [Acidimicrobiaceae bacterium]
MGHEAPRPRAALDGIGRYRPGKAAETAMHEHDIASAIKLASNELPYGPLPAAERAVVEAMHHGNRYADHLAVELRQALGDRHGVDVGQVAVGCGSVGLLQQLFLSYVDPGDEVLYGWRTFETYPIYARVVSGNAVTVALRRQALDAEALVAAASERTRMLLITSPNNPTGTALGRAELRHVLESVSPHTLVVLDEAYREFMTRADRPDSVALLAEFPNFVVLRTFSKAYGLAALRVGYAFAAPDVVDSLVKTLVPFTVNGLGQAAALASLAATDELRARLDSVLGERARVERELRSAGFSVPDPQANFVWLPAGAAAEALTVGLEKRGVVSRPFPGEGVRVTIGTFEENHRFLTTFVEVAAEVDAAASWELPTGKTARRVASVLDRLDAAIDRLAAHAVAPGAGQTDPDPPTGERWDAGQVFAHVGEIGGYWQGQWNAVIDAGAVGPVPFGRTKRDAQR